MQNFGKTHFYYDFCQIGNLVLNSIYGIIVAVYSQLWLSFLGDKNKLIILF